MSWRVGGLGERPDHGRLRLRHRRSAGQTAVRRGDPSTRADAIRPPCGQPLPTGADRCTVAPYVPDPSTVDRDRAGGREVHGSLAGARMPPRLPQAVDNCVDGGCVTQDGAGHVGERLNHVDLAVPVRKNVYPNLDSARMQNDNAGQ